MQTALLTSYAKDEPLLRLGRLLVLNKWSLLGSVGTTKFLKDNGIPCRDAEEIAGAPILGHRVVTLAREIYAGLLATAEDNAELQRIGISRIDLVYVVLYPLQKTIANPAATPADVIEKTDIGGPTLLRAAAKGRRVALSDPSQLDEFERRLRDGSLDEKYRATLAAAAERRVADYVAVSARYWENKTR